MFSASRYLHELSTVWFILVPYHYEDGGDDGGDGDHGGAGGVLHRGMKKI